MEERSTYNSQKKQVFFPLITTLGIVLFFLFYVIATTHYPGGSNFDPTENGFNWLTNYWCEMLYEYSKNGHLNTARPYALTAMISLTISVGYFWFSYPKLLSINYGLQEWIRWPGVISMVLSSFIFTNFHDSIIYASVITGSVAYVGLIYAFFKTNKSSFGYFGIVCLSLILLNNLLYVANFNLELLPLLQKITFLLTLAWIFSVSINYKIHLVNRLHND
jgi:hypothetical protein